MTTEHEDEIDAVEEKAKAIGKEIGVEEEEIPEFEIEEEDDSDAPVAKETAKAKEERVERDKLTNRDKRQLRKKKINDKFSEKDAIIAAQSSRLEELERRQNASDARWQGVNKAEVDKAINDTAAIYEKAKKDSLEAFNEGDGAKHLLALETMKNADDRYKQLHGMKQNIERAPAANSATNGQAKQDPRVTKKLKEWEARNDWYDPASGDADSAVTQTIAGVLIQEGFDPKSEEYWDELDERITKYMPDKLGAVDEDEDEIPSPRKRSAPPVSGGAKRGDVGGKRTIKLPTSYIEKMKREAPEIWNDPKRRAKLLNDRARILKENGQ